MPVALITGATSGLGRELALRFDQEGWQLILSGRDAERFPPLSNPASRTVVGDLRGHDSAMGSLVRTAKDTGLDCLINCAGVRVGKAFPDMLMCDMREQVETNLLVPMELTKRLWSLFERQRSGTVINVGSIAACTPGNGETAYAASKAGLRSFSQALQFDATRIGVRVVYVSMGAMRTEMTQGRSNHDLMVDPAEAAGVVFGLLAQPPSLRVLDITIQRSHY